MGPSNVVSPLDKFRMVIAATLIGVWIVLAIIDANSRYFTMTLYHHAALLLPAGWLFSSPLANAVFGRKNGNGDRS